MCCQLQHWGRENAAITVSMISHQGNIGLSGKVVDTSGSKSFAASFKHCSELIDSIGTGRLFWGGGGTSCRYLC